MTKPTVSDERLAEMVGAGMPCVPIMAGEVAQVVQELRQRRAQEKPDPHALERKRRAAGPSSIGWPFQDPLAKYKEPTQPPTPASGEQLEVVRDLLSDICRHWDDPAYIELLTGVEIPEALRALDAAQNAITAANERAERLETEIAEYQLSFDLHWAASMRAIKLWQGRNPGNDRKWPDAAALELWLMEAVTDAEALNITLSEALIEIECHAAARPAIRNIATAALAALPAKQGGQS